ncbi:MAG: hypothetical protein ABI476_10820, partial [Oxalobacteraceae bacterium]
QSKKSFHRFFRRNGVGCKRSKAGIVSDKTIFPAGVGPAVATAAHMKAGDRYGRLAAVVSGLCNKNRGYAVKTAYSRMKLLRL